MHCLNQLLPPTPNTQHILRDTVHSYIYCQVVPFNSTKTPLAFSACFVSLSPD